MATEEDFVNFQKYNTEYFRFWREGRHYEWENDPDGQREEAKKIQFPRPGAWGGHKQHRVSRSRRHRITKPTNLKGPAEHKAAALNVSRVLEGKLKAADLRFLKILGWGGLGIACLYEVTGANGEKYNIVCKANLRKEYNYVLERERQSHISMAGAKHIVQRVVLQAPPKRDPRAHKVQGRAAVTFDKILGKVADDFEDLVVIDKKEVVDDQKEATKKKLDAKQNLLFIEFMRRGDLDTYLEKVGVQRMRFPDQILWQIFHCLFKACVAMAHPSKFQPPGSDPTTTNLPQVSESYDSPHKIDFSEPVMVHFDIDPLNILVGEFDEDEHNLVPLVKVADLGVAQLVDWRVRNEKTEAWALRRIGKQDTMSPEQFTEEWDYVPGAPFHRGRLMGENTAGNYHWWTNLYQVGLVMWSLITTCRPEHPPEVRQYTWKQSGGAEVVGWTYGEWLLDSGFNNIDLELRELVVRCLDHDPTCRPNMDALAEVFRNRARGGASTADDRKVQRISQQIFGDPAPPRPVQPSIPAVVAAQYQQPPAPAAPGLPPPPPPPPVNMPYAGTAGAQQNPFPFKPLPPPGAPQLPFKPYRPPPGTVNPPPNPRPVSFKPYRAPGTVNPPPNPRPVSFKPRRSPPKAFKPYRPPGTVNPPPNPRPVSFKPHRPPSKAFKPYRPPPGTVNPPRAAAPLPRNPTPLRTNAPARPPPPPPPPANTPPLPPPAKASPPVPGGNQATPHPSPGRVPFSFEELPATHAVATGDGRQRPRRRSQARRMFKQMFRLR